MGNNLESFDDIDLDKCPNLETLSISSNPINSNGFEKILKLKNLKWIDF